MNPPFLLIRRENRNIRPHNPDRLGDDPAPVGRSRSRSHRPGLGALGPEGTLLKEFSISFPTSTPLTSFSISFSTLTLTSTSITSFRSQDAHAGPRPSAKHASARRPAFGEAGVARGAAEGEGRGLDDGPGAQQSVEGSRGREVLTGRGARVHVLPRRGEEEGNCQAAGDGSGGTSGSGAGNQASGLYFLDKLVEDPMNALLET